MTIGAGVVRFYLLRIMKRPYAVVMVIIERLRKGVASVNCWTNLLLTGLWDQALKPRYHRSLGKQIRYVVSQKLSGSAMDRASPPCSTEKLLSIGTGTSWGSLNYTRDTKVTRGDFFLCPSSGLCFLYCPLYVKIHKEICIELCISRDQKTIQADQNGI